MDGEREIYREIGEPGQYVYVVTCGELDDYLLDAMDAFVKRQKERLKKEAKRKVLE